MNRPNHAITWLIAAMSAAACLTAASMAPSRSTRPAVRLLDPPVRVAGPSARDLRLQAMHRLMTPVRTEIPVTVPANDVAPVATEPTPAEPVAVEVSAAESAESVELSYESSCGFDHNTGKVYTLPAEESAQPEPAPEETREATAHRSRPAVRHGSRPTVVIYRRPTLVLKTENQVRDERTVDRLRTVVRSTLDQLSFGAWQTASQVWVDQLTLPWDQLTKQAPAEAPDRESRVLPAYRSVLRNRTLQ